MDDILTIIQQRRSVRAFTDRMPDADTIKKLLEAARWAPSGLNNQPWKFMIIQDTKTKDELAQLTSYGKIIKGAPVSIIACLDNAISYNRDKDLMAVGAAIQNMLLSAHALGLGACWLGEIINRKQKVSQCLKLEDNLEVMAVIAVGYASEPLGEGERKLLEELILGKIPS